MVILNKGKSFLLLYLVKLLIIIMKCIKKLKLIFRKFKHD